MTSALWSSATATPLRVSWSWLPHPFELLSHVGITDSWRWAQLQTLLSFPRNRCCCVFGRTQSCVHRHYPSWPTHSWGEILSTWDRVEARPREPGWLFWMFRPENLAQDTKRVFKIEITETFREFIIWSHYFYLGQLPAWRPPINFGRKEWKAVK